MSRKLTALFAAAAMLSGLGAMTTGFAEEANPSPQMPGAHGMMGDPGGMMNMMGQMGPDQMMNMMGQMSPDQMMNMMAQMSPDQMINMMGQMSPDHMKQMTRMVDNCNRMMESMNNPPTAPDHQPAPDTHQ